MEQRWLTTCRIPLVAHANGSLEYSTEMNCVSKGSCFFFPFALNYSLKKIPEVMLWILQWHQWYYFRARRVCFRRPVLMEFYKFPRKGTLTLINCLIFFKKRTIFNFRLTVDCRASKQLRKTEIWVLQYLCVKMKSNFNVATSWSTTDKGSDRFICIYTLHTSHLSCLPH